MINLYLKEVTALVKTATIYGINGPGHLSERKYRFKNVRNGLCRKEKLVGEVIALDKDLTTVQVYEETSGLKSGRDSYCNRRWQYLLHLLPES